MRDFAKSLGILVLGGREGGFGAKMETFLPFSLFEVPVLFVAPKRQKNHFDLGDTLFIPEKDIAPICLPKALNSILIHCLLSVLWRYQSMFKKISKSCLQLRYQTRVLSLHPWPYFLPTPLKSKKKINKPASISFYNPFWVTLWHSYEN